MAGVDLAHTVGPVDAQATAVIRRARSILDGLRSRTRTCELLEAALEQGAPRQGVTVPIVQPTRAIR